jgi:C4-dicarboxylate transporter DctM subunit
VTDVAIWTGLLTLVLLLVLGIPVGLAMLAAGVLGLWLGFGLDVAFDYIASSFYREAASFALAAIPLFLFMGALGADSNIWRRLFEFVYRLIGRFRGGMGMAIVSAGGLFGAVSGSSTAGAAALGKIVVDQAEHYGYERRFTLACAAASATAAVMIPPSITLIVFALLTQTSVARLFIAGIVPGVLSAVLYMVTVYVLALRRPESMPRGRVFSLREQVQGTLGALPVLAVIVTVIAGIYLGVFTPTEAGAIGALGIAVIAALLGGQYLPGVLRAAGEAAGTTAMIFLIIVGAFVFSRFLSINRIPQDIAAWVGDLPVNRYVILIVLLAIYIVMGTFMDQLAIQVLTLPIVYPLILEMDFNPYWFAIIFVKTVEIGLITPPLGLNVYVLSSVAKVPVEDAFRGVTPFFAVDVLTLALLVAVPSIALWLPGVALG